MTKRLSEAQIIGLLCEAEAGLPVNQTRLGTLSRQSGSMITLPRRTETVPDRGRSFAP